MYVITSVSFAAAMCAFSAVWSFTRASIYKKKWKALQGEYDKRCKEHEAEKEDIVQYLKYTQGVLFWGHRNLSVKEISKTEMAIIGTTSKSPEEMVVKIFHFNPNDPEDREFAIREAEELIETIQKF